MTVQSKLDTLHYHETPEGIQLAVRVAGPIVRAAAWLIDALIRAAFYLSLGLLSAFFGGVGVGVTLIVLFLIEWFYPVLFEVQLGATPGKRAMGLLVLHDNGTPVNWSSSLLRNLLRAADFFPSFYGLGLLTMLIHPSFKRLGDIAAGTLVVYQEKPPQTNQLPKAEPQPPPRSLSLDEQRALLEFAERHHQLSRARQAELANQLSGLTGQSGAEGVAVLHSYAQWLAKGR